MIIKRDAVLLQIMRIFVTDTGLNTSLWNGCIQSRYLKHNVYVDLDFS